MILHMKEESELVAACTQIKDDINEMKTTYTVDWSLNSLIFPFVVFLSLRFCSESMYNYCHILKLTLTLFVSFTTRGSLIS